MARERSLAVALVAAAACSRGDGAPAPAAHAAPLAGKAFYRIDAAPLAPCAAGSACQARLVLSALGDYHVNKDYPFKFLGDAAPAPAVDGTGAFAIDDAKHGTMTVVFHPAAAGTAHLAGTFKLSVCSDETCEIESPKLDVAVA